MEAYFDNSATTKCYESVRNIVIKTMCEDYGNPSSMHMKGVEAEQYIKEAKEIIAKTLKVKSKELIFTSGGTESDNLAIIGAALANRRSGKHLITTQIEHAAVCSTMQFLETQGFRVSYLPVDKKGVLSLEALEREICEETVLVSIMYTNNEIGTVQPIEEAAKLMKKKNPRTLLHVDAVQGYGKHYIFPKRTGIDLLSVSGHKIHAPKGVGFLYVDEKVKLKPILFGGGHQGGLRSGTENVSGVAGLAAAAKEIYTDFEKKQEHLYKLKETLIAGLKELKDVQINGSCGTESAPHIVSAGFKGVRSEVLLHALEERKIYISAGSACSSKKPSVSAVLNAIGLEKDMLGSVVRFSFSEMNTLEEVQYCLEALRELLPALRRYV